MLVLKLKKLFVLFICGLLVLSSMGQEPVKAADWSAKIDPWLLGQAESLEPDEDIEFLVVLTAKADLSGVELSWSKEQKGTYVFEKLTEIARSTQAPVLHQLQLDGAETRPYWITNMIWARGPWEAVQATASRADVEKIVGNPHTRGSDPDVSQIVSPAAPAVLEAGPEAIEPNLLVINADDVWALGYTGQGVVIGGQDTGYAWQHPALINSYRGWNGSVADHNYNWHDAIDVEGNGLCDPESTFPCDDNGHGSHTMGIMVGDDGAGNQIGAAPGVEWIGCRARDNMVGSPASYSECFEWFVAPYPVGGDPFNGDPTRAPDIVNNSWECFASEGCDPSTLHDVVVAVRQAGIFLAASAGNQGPACNTVDNPSAVYDEVFTVGNVNNNNGIDSNSSRGPSDYGGAVNMKPDVTAPGLDIRSCNRTTGYMTATGTSMAAPHVAGTAALLISAQPALRGNVDAIEGLLRLGAVPLTAPNENCGGVPGTQVPNNTYGWGRIDALASLQHIDDLLVAGFEAPSSVNLGDPVQFTNTTFGLEPITYLWDFGDGICGSTEENPSYTYSAPGIFTVSLTATNSLAVDVFSSTIEVVPVGSVNIESVTLTQQTPGPIYPAEPVSLLAEFFPINLTLPVTYTVDFGDGTPVMTDTIAAPSVVLEHTYLFAGTYSVELAAWNNNMDPSEAVFASLDVLVETVPLPVDIESVSLTLESGGTLYPFSHVDFRAVFSPADLTLPVTYTIDFGDGTPLVPTIVTATEVEFSHFYTASGTYGVTVRAWNNQMDPVDAVTDQVEVLITPWVPKYWLYLPAITRAEPDIL